MTKTLPLLLAGASTALAQCSMCRTAASAQPPGASQAMNTAILILLVPALGLFSTVFLVAFRSDPHDEEDDPE